MSIDDDTDDKIRRNLVSSSTLVLLGSWLQFEPMSILKKILGEEIGGQVSAWRLWLVILALLVYFGHRYRFSTAMSDALGHLRLERDSTSFALVISTLKSELTKYSKLQINNVAPSFTVPLKTVLSNYGTTGSSKPIKLNFDSVTIYERENGSLYDGTVSFTADWQEGKIVSMGIKAQFKIPRLKRLGIEARCAIGLLLYSRSSTAFLMPVILFIFALLNSVFHLVKAI